LTLQDLDCIFNDIEVKGDIIEDVYKGNISQVLAVLPNHDFDIILHQRNIIYVVLGRNNKTYGFSEFINLTENSNPLFIIGLSVFEFNKNDFQDTVAHELAHVFYQDTLSMVFEGKESILNSAFYEIRADMLAEKWGFLKNKNRSCLYGDFWDFYQKEGIDRNQTIARVINWQKMMNNCLG